MATRFRAWDDYFIPGTSVLGNKFNETDPAKLSAKEKLAAQVRLVELAAKPIAGNFDYDHMKAIHRHIFQDVYEWAGEERVGPLGFMFKEGHSYYAAGPSLTQAAHAEYAKIADKNFLRGLDKEQFVDELAERWGELNVIHSFREGNTRTQFVFFSQLAEKADYRIDTEAFKMGSPLRDEFVAARFHSQDTGSNARLAAVLSKAIEPIVPGPATPPALSAELLHIQEQRQIAFPQSPIAKPPAERGSSTPAPPIHRLPPKGLADDHGLGR